MKYFWPRPASMVQAIRSPGWNRFMGLDQEGDEGFVLAEVEEGELGLGEAGVEDGVIEVIGLRSELGSEGAIIRAGSEGSPAGVIAESIVPPTEEEDLVGAVAETEDDVVEVFVFVFELLLHHIAWLPDGSPGWVDV